MTPFIKLTESQAAAIRNGNHLVWQQLKTEDITPELKKFIERQRKGK